MTDSRLELLQWVGLLGAGLVWAVQLVIGFGVVEAACSVALLGVDVRTWQIALTATAAALVLVAEASALTVFLATRPADHGDPAPTGRRHFFASAAVVGNVLFLCVVLLSGIGALSLSPCRS
jgi:hypothetical protein